MGGTMPAAPGTWAKWVDIVLAVVASLLTIATIALGIAVGNQQGTITNTNQTINNVQQANTSLESAYAALSSSNAALEQSIVSLQSQIATGPVTLSSNTAAVSTTSTPAPVTESLPAGVTIRHSGTFNLAKGQDIDLDAPQSDPIWFTPGDPFELRKKDDPEGGVYKGASMRMVIVNDAIPTYSYCSQQREYTPETSEAVGFVQIPHGWYCIRTSGNRYAILHYDSDKAYADQITLTATTYDPPVG